MSSPLSNDVGADLLAERFDVPVRDQVKQLRDTVRKLRVFLRDSGDLVDEIAFLPDTPLHTAEQLRDLAVQMRMFAGNTRRGDR